MHQGFKNIIWILFLLAWGCSKAPLPPDSENNVIDIDGDGKGEIQITTIDVDGASIKEAKIFLNGDFIGKSPTVIKGVPFGLHTLRAQKVGYEIYSETVTVESELAISRELILRKPPLNTGQLLVTVNIDSAKTTVTNAHNE
ncbi:PEGA domain-containing protein, partial [candidate division KSB1 bacterium]|nr:PEGA domain-containing protein [candidate division KSB1 bacterium]